MRIPELLAPAGDLERAKTALLYGADAVYIGGKCGSLRARAANFTLPEIREAVLFAHALKKKVYVTVNIVPHDEDIPRLEAFIQELAQAHVDALIVTSLALARFAQMLSPALPVHASTQLSTLNVDAARGLMDEGFTRVVLGRETSLDEIETISRALPGAIEVFIHGGMCLSYAGRCTLSRHLTGRDANRGDCTHCCRWDYRYEGAPFYMGSRDLCGLPALSRLAKAGVASLKIEGRMKSAYYLAVVVGVYRKVLDALARDESPDLETARAELARAESRPGASGYLFHEPGSAETVLTGRVHENRQDYLAVVVAWDQESGIATLSQRNHFTSGEAVEFIGPGRGPLACILPSFTAEDGATKTVACIAEERVHLVVPFPLSAGDFMRRKP